MYNLGMKSSGKGFTLVLAVPAACCVDIFLPSLAVAPLLKISWPQFESFTICREEEDVLIVPLVASQH